MNDYLVILTTRGTLHITEASADKYRELTRLTVSNELCWTPPTIIGRQIFVRDSKEMIASVDIVPDRGEVVAEKPTQHRPLLKSDIIRDLERIADADNSQEAANRFMARYDTLPIIESDTLVHFFYQGPGSDVALKADFLPPSHQKPLRRVPGTDLYHTALNLDPRARVGYRFVVDFEKNVPDPRNPYTLASYLWGGDFSQLSMPKADAPLETLFPAILDSSRLERIEIFSERRHVGSKTWGGSREILVYLPRGYHDEQERYPVLYHLNGPPAVTIGQTPEILDALVARGSIHPVIAVFVQSISPYELARSQFGEYERMLLEQIIPMIESRYRAEAVRALLGGHEAAYAALNLAFRHPDMFQKVASQSFWPVGDGEALLHQRIEDSERLPLQIYLGWGKYDLRVASAALIDVPAACRRLMQTLQSAGYQVMGGEVPEGGDFAAWRRQMPKILRSFFPPATQAE